MRRFGMADRPQFNRFGEEIESILKLPTSPIALKMLESESDIPEGAFRPRQDEGYHILNARLLRFLDVQERQSLC
jgi:uncharacterized protein (DUF169 family)